MHFAPRTAFESHESVYGAALQRARQRGNLLDLTVSNPTRCGFRLPHDLLAPLAEEAAATYDPDPLGMRSAREAVSRMYRERHGATVAPDRLLLTGSTSEAYSYLLRLFCEPGSAILVPSPSYPLFDLLGRLHDVEVIPYPLLYHDGWQVDAAALESLVTPACRALVTIHPNNPTGHFCSAADRDMLYRCAAAHSLPLIVDEVFLDYPVESKGSDSFLCGDPPGSAEVLTCVLGGLSKQLCLPQMKLAWMAVRGPEALATEAMARLAVIADTFLSVGTPPQLALPTWLQQGNPAADELRQRVRENLARMDELLKGTAVSRLRVEAGWAAVLRVPALDDDEALAVHLLDRHGIAVHPGSFYGFPARGWLVVSLLPHPAEFQQGLATLVREF